MTGQFTYQVPDQESFIYTLRVFLESTGHDDIAALLMGASCDIEPTGSFSGVRWDAWATNVILFVPVSLIPKFTENVRSTLLSACDSVMPSNAGLDVLGLAVSPILQSPPEDGHHHPLNTGSLVSDAPIAHDGLRFRSRTETRIYDALKRKKVLFFPNATAVLGGGPEKREPDFLICQDGKWGILEVMGEPYHPGATAMRDHDRARLFKDYGLLTVEFYDAARCFNEPDQVINDFLSRLART